MLFLNNLYKTNFDVPTPWGIYFQDSATPLSEWSGKLLVGVKLPNSEEILKPRVPSRIWKYIGGWINYLCMVISLRIIKRAIGNRGSKSVICRQKIIFLEFCVAVKEQRVDGSCIMSRDIMLKCSLMGFRRKHR